MSKNFKSAMSSKNTNYDKRPPKSCNESLSVNPISIITPNDCICLEILTKTYAYVIMFDDVLQYDLSGISC